MQQRLADLARETQDGKERQAVTAAAAASARDAAD